MVKRVSRDDRRKISRWIANMGRYNWLGQFNRLSCTRRAKIAKAELRLPYRNLGHGFYRIVYDLGNGYVLKVAISSSGMRSNEMEYRLYNSSSNYIKQHLCPVVGFGHGWIMMKKMKVLSTGKLYMLKGLRSKFRKAGIRPNDIKRSNTAMYEGRIVVLDYGDFNL